MQKRRWKLVPRLDSKYFRRFEWWCLQQPLARRPCPCWKAHLCRRHLPMAKMHKLPR